MSAELTVEEPEAVPEEFPELLAFPVPLDELVPELELLDEFVPELELLDELVTELELLDELEMLPPAAELFEFDVKESELSCSVPLLAQPVIVHARSAQTITEVISFFIFYSLSRTNIIGDFTLHSRNTNILH